MTDFPLAIIAGNTAWQQIREHRWSPALFDTLVGASGGAKLLALTHLDRFIFGDYLCRSNHSMELYGSSIGSWRHAALAAPDPFKAITALQEHYLNQSWDENDTRSPGEIVDELCDWVIDGFCTPEVISNLCRHPRFTTHIVAARGLGLTNRGRSFGLGLGMGFAAMSNVLSRQLLAKHFQRVVFSTGLSRSFQFSDFNTEHHDLTTDNVKLALLASGSIPFLMSGQKDVPGTSGGQLWDGGIIDYHFDFANQVGQGLVLYPHFTKRVIKGWFDKQLPWRTNRPDVLDRTVVLAPSSSYLDRLPYRKIPDRKDFSTMSTAERLSYWNKAMAMSLELADCFAGVVESDNPVEHVVRFDETT